MGMGRELLVEKGPNRSGRHGGELETVWRTWDVMGEKLEDQQLSV